MAGRTQLRSVLPVRPDHPVISAIAPFGLTWSAPQLEGVILDAAAARKKARDEAFRASPDGAMMRAIMGG